MTPAAGEAEPTKYFYNFTGMGQPDTVIEADGYDYVDFPVDDVARDGSPTSWGGMSGGGLWPVELTSPEGTLMPKRALLSGLLYYQVATTATSCGVKGHCRKSIYGVAYAALDASG